MSSPRCWMVRNSARAHAPANVRILRKRRMNDSGAEGEGEGELRELGEFDELGSSSRSMWIGMIARGGRGVAREFDGALARSPRHARHWAPTRTIPRMPGSHGDWPPRPGSAPASAGTRL